MAEIILDIKKIRTIGPDEEVTGTVVMAPEEEVEGGPTLVDQLLLQAPPLSSIFIRSILFRRLVSKDRTPRSVNATIFSGSHWKTSSESLIYYSGGLGLSR